ncbi:glycosyltransferase family 39 protein [Candidatus Marithrix sp. Canyon 246]|uniref:glycosyltransferase family 39 protein n=1 Tax=Candidatus Marithrix sp. Canyon 246 TaxID=1827136 RepID=UPI00084A017A|nr:glycosyltransferase family 39 protein [Candidatus Marithrix sp. Canyon 246]
MTKNLKTTLLIWLPWLIIALGIILRLDQYLFNRSLWLDESFVVINVINRSWLELFQAPLEYTGYITPPGFLLMAKLSITVFGNSDFILRLFPFISGILALILYYPMAKRYVSEHAVPFALLLFAICSQLIIYSSDFKQYSSDVLIAIVLYLLADYIRRHSLNFSRLLLLTIVGSIAVWFSHPSVFILATIGIYLAFPYLLNQQWKQVAKLTLVYMLWLVNFAIIFFFLLSVETVYDKWLHEFWIINGGFMPAPFSMEGIQWLYTKFALILNNLASLGAIKVAAVLMIIGFMTLLLNKKPAWFLFTMPIVIALCLSFFQMYVFSDRLLLFILPVLYLMIAEGIAKIPTIVAQILIVLILILFPIYQNFIIKDNHVIEEIKPVLETVQGHRLNTDKVYIYYWAEPAFRYYANHYGFNYENCHIINPIAKTEHIKEVDFSRMQRDLKPVAVNDTQCILGNSEFFHPSLKDLEQLKGQGRVWFIFSHLGEHERPLFLNYLDSIGTRLDENLQPGSSAYLYKF